MVFPTLEEEQKLWDKGYKYVCGVDEVGRGCFAGPVVVGAVIFPVGCGLIEGVADSKLLKASKRDILAPKIKENALSWSIAEVGVEVINEVGIGRATQLAFMEAVKNLSTPPDFVLIDAFYISDLIREIQKPLKDGDKISYSISAASIIAKVYRDTLMENLHKDYPDYNFAKHKGYGTKEHREAIRNYGLTELHRTSFNLGKLLD
jgi:ribonuclease HII